MEQEKIIEVVGKYRQLFETLGVKPVSMDENKYFGDLSREECMSHACFLLDGVEEYSKDPSKKGKTGRHLASVQMILSFCKVFTLKELKDHNRPN